MTVSQVTASLATIPSRAHTLPATIYSLLPQVDRLNVYLNGFDEPPAFLTEHSKISFALSRSYGDRGDAGKFFWAGRVSGYYFACDDDLVYPHDYVEYMVGRLDAYRCRPIVSLHGSLLHDPVESYYQDRTTHHCLLAVEEDEPVHVVGTGVCAYHTDHIALTPEVFELPNMADIWLALFAKTHRIPLVVLAHPALYLDYQFVEDSIYRRAMTTGDQLHTNIINRGAPWKAPLAIVADSKASTIS